MTARQDVRLIEPDDTGSKPMLTDRMTARILGLVVLALTVIIDVSCFIFARAETRQSPRFALVVFLTSVPLFLASALLFRKAAKLPEIDESDAPNR